MCGSEIFFLFLITQICYLFIYLGILWVFGRCGRNKIGVISLNIFEVAIIEMKTP